MPRRAVRALHSGHRPLHDLRRRRAPPLAVARTSAGWSRQQSPRKPNPAAPRRARCAHVACALLACGDAQATISPENEPLRVLETMIAGRGVDARSNRSSLPHPASLRAPAPRRAGSHARGARTIASDSSPRRRTAIATATKGSHAPTVPHKCYATRERDRPQPTGPDEPNGDQAQLHEDAALARAGRAGTLGRGRHQFCLQRQHRNGTVDVRREADQLAATAKSITPRLSPGVVIP